MIRLEEYMSRPVITCKPGESVTSVCKLMDKNNIGSVIVADSSGVQGIITERDIIRKVMSKELSPGDIKVRDVMTLKVHSVTVDATIMEIAALMKKHSMRRILVSSEGRPVGIVTSRDLIGLLV